MIPAEVIRRKILAASAVLGFQRPGPDILTTIGIVEGHPGRLSIGLVDGLPKGVPRGGHAKDPTAGGFEDAVLQLCAGHKDLGVQIVG